MQALKSLNLTKLTINSHKSLASAFNLIKYENRKFQLSAQNLVSKEFEEAKLKLSNLQEDPGNDVKLKIYALFKQATVGKCNTPKPSMVDFVGRAKWTAWSELEMSQTEAEKIYIDTINELVKNEAPEVSEDPSSQTQFKNILVSVEYNSIYKIVLNRPTKLNAINIPMYNELIQALNEADKNPNISAVCITGAGDYYCAGNDLTSFTTKEAMQNMKQSAKDGGVLCEAFVNAFINISKPLVAVINGPAVGISVTLLGLFDLVLASNKATFVAPFTKIAQSPEACSSYTFPRMMGHLRAAEFLVFNRKLNAQEALARNMVTEVFPDDEFQVKAWKMVESISKLPKESLREARNILRDGDKELLRQVNKRECDVLVGRWCSSEFVRVMMEFWGKKQK